MSAFYEGLCGSDSSLKHPVESQIQSTLSFVQDHKDLLNTINKPDHNAEIPNIAINMNVDLTERVLIHDIIKVCIYFDSNYFPIIY
jgi:hypothetical protein